LIKMTSQISAYAFLTDDVHYAVTYHGVEHSAEVGNNTKWYLAPVTLENRWI
jgi:hypothetical protein